MSYIYLCPIEPINNNLTDKIPSAIENIFHFPVKFIKPDFKSEIAYDFSREQFKSSVLMRGILNLVDDSTEKIIGITDVDLFVPVLTFIFGEAQLNGKVSLVSVTRLKNEFYGLPKNEDILISRLLKEVVHELGHNFGLIHCKRYDCVMNSSIYVENIDLKSITFCESCHNILFKTSLENNA